MNPTKEQLADPKWWNENAPVDATRYACEDHDCRPLWVKDGYYSCADEAFVKWHKDHDPTMHGELISRPSEWSGEGLPPVGTVCEAWHNGCAQGVVQVRYSGGCMVLWNVKLKHEQCSASENYTFKPIRTPEQIAAEDALIEIERLYGEGGPAAVYDAGYRKAK